MRIKKNGLELILPIGQVGVDFYWALFEIGKAKKGRKSDFQCIVLSWYAPINTIYLTLFPSTLVVIRVILIAYLFKGRKDIFVIHAGSKTPVVFGKDDQEF